MPILPFDPADEDLFWSAISELPGFPADEEIPLRDMVFQSGALYALPEILNRNGINSYKPLLLVMDSTPMKRKDESLKPLLAHLLQEAGLDLRVMILEPDASGQVHTDMARISGVKQRLAPDMGVLSVGSGVVTDITKHACYLFEQETGVQLPFVVFQTANSVTAYTSNMSVVFLDGVKRTLPSRYPSALVCDLETVADAPREMTAGGVGDLLAMYISIPDWRLANLLGMDPTYAEMGVDLFGGLDEILLENAEAIRDSTIDGMEVLAKLIALAGLLSSFRHTTAPISGYEHVISHVLDMVNEANHRPLAVHGSQVAAAAIYCAGAYEEFLRDFNPAEIDVDRCYPDESEMQTLVLNVFNSLDPDGKIALECWADYQIKLKNWYAHKQEFQDFLDQWDIVREELSSLTRSAERLVQILRLIKAPVSFEQLQPAASSEDVRYAFLHAPFMRKRLTLGDILFYTNWDREQLWTKLDSKIRTFIKKSS